MERETPLATGEPESALSLAVSALPGTGLPSACRTSGARPSMVHSVKPPGDESPLRNVIGKFRGK